MVYPPMALNKCVSEHYTEIEPKKYLSDINT